MKITEYAPLKKTREALKKSATSSSAADGDFMGLLSAEETESAAPLSNAAELQPVSMDALLSLQEMPDDEVKKRRAAVEEGKGTIEALETLHMALLSGSVPEHLLHTLTKVVAHQKQRVDDPRLKSIIEDIELRAAVELAKLERASSGG